MGIPLIMHIKSSVLVYYLANSCVMSGLDYKYLIESLWYELEVWGLKNMGHLIRCNETQY